jgi:hypothetical protein
MRGRADQAVRLWAASDRLRKSAGAGLVPPERALQDRHLTRLRDDLDQVAFQAAWQGGQAMDLDDAVASVQNSWAPV